MNINNLKQIRKKFEKEYDENSLKIEELTEKIKIIQANDFETKVTGVVGFSLITWIIELLLLPFIIKTGIISLNLLRPLFFVIPIAIGVAAEKLYIKNTKCLEKLRKFSKSKTQKENIEESTKLEIERKKLKFLNIVLKKEYTDLSTMENNVNTLLENYDITKKNVVNKTNEEIITRVDNLNDLLIQKQQEADVITTKCVLKDRFENIRTNNKAAWIFDMLGSCATIGMMCTLLYHAPAFYLSQLQPNIISALAPFVVGGVVCGTSLSKIKKDNIDIFKKFNKKLANQAISDFDNFDENKQIDKDLVNIIREICVIKLQLENEKIELESSSLIPDSKNANKNILNAPTEVEEFKIGVPQEEGPVLLRKKNN